MKMKMKKYGKMISIFEFFLSKEITYIQKFSWNSEEKNINQFFGHYWLVNTKMKLKMKKYGKMSLIFESSILKLGYEAVFLEIWEKNFDSFLKTMLINQEKNEDEDEEI